MQMRHLVEKIVRALVDSPEAVDVKEIEQSAMKILEVRVSKHDIGNLIGENGRNIEALRRVVSAAARDENYMVEVVLRISAIDEISIFDMVGIEELEREQSPTMN